MTFTINESHPQATALVELLKTFSFVSFKETKTKTKKTATKEKALKIMNLLWHFLKKPIEM